MSNEKTPVGELQQENINLKLEVSTLKSEKESLKDELNSLKNEYDELEESKKDVDYGELDVKELMLQILRNNKAETSMFNEMKCEVFFANIEKFKLEELEAFVNRFSLV